MGDTAGSNKLGGNLLYHSKSEISTMYLVSTWHSHELGEGRLLFPHWYAEQSEPKPPPQKIKPEKGIVFYVACENTIAHSMMWDYYLVYAMQNFRKSGNNLQKNVRNKLTCLGLKAVFRSKAIIWFNLGQPL